MLHYLFNYIVWYFKRKKYHKYLKSDTWKQKAMRCKRLHKYRCKYCKSKIKLQCHHLTYTRIFHEKQSDLVCVCEKCHKKLHKK